MQNDIFKLKQKILIPPYNIYFLFLFFYKIIFMSLQFQLMKGDCSNFLIYVLFWSWSGSLATCIFCCFIYICCFSLVSKSHEIRGHFILTDFWRTNLHSLNHGRFSLSSVIIKLLQENMYIYLNLSKNKTQKFDVEEPQRESQSNLGCLTWNKERIFGKCNRSKYCIVSVMRGLTSVLKLLGTSFYFMIPSS